MNGMPSEFNLGGIYLPPMLVASCLGVLLAWLTAGQLNHHRLTTHLFYPPLVFVALVAIYTVAVGYLIIPF